MTYYRLVYKDGTHGAWTRNYEWIADCARFFGAKIESRVFGEI